LPVAGGDETKKSILRANFPRRIKSNRLAAIRLVP
jgi:hypothetical protein